MVTVTLDEITLNAIKAALDERIKRLDAETLEVGRQITGWQDGRQWPGDYSEDFQRAYVWNVAALHETKLAREIVGDAEPFEDHPEDETWTNREGMPEFNGAFSR